MGKRCLKCGYDAPQGPDGFDAECPKCGAIYAKVEAIVARRDTPGPNVAATQSVPNKATGRIGRATIIIGGCAIAVIVAMLALAILGAAKRPNGEPISFEQRNKGMAEMRNIEVRWVDGIKLASSTPRMALSAPVANLQAIKRELSPIEVSACLREAKVSLDRHMNTAIQAFLKFLGDASEKGDVEFIRAKTELDEYKVNRDKCVSQ